MSRQIVNRIILAVFVVVMFSMAMIYIKQENKIKTLKEEHDALKQKAERIEYVINEYNILIENLDSRNYIIRMARDMFGWVFDDEIVYKKPVADPVTPEGTTNP